MCVKTVSSGMLCVSSSGGGIRPDDRRRNGLFRGGVVGVMLREDCGGCGGLRGTWSRGMRRYVGIDAGLTEEEATGPTLSSDRPDPDGQGEDKV